MYLFMMVFYFIALLIYCYIIFIIVYNFYINSNKINKKSKLLSKISKIAKIDKDLLI
jgi:uncharacterized membrane protein